MPSVVILIIVQSIKIESILPSDILFDVMAPNSLHGKMHSEDTADYPVRA
jgi:hypothetical protein